MQPVIRAEGLTKRYGKTLALDSLDLAVDEGEVYGYRGPNGFGKTTTIRLLLGLHHRSDGRRSGDATWRGCSVAGAMVVAGSLPTPLSHRRARAVGGKVEG